MYIIFKYLQIDISSEQALPHLADKINIYSVDIFTKIFFFLILNKTALHIFRESRSY